MARIEHLSLIFPEAGSKLRNAHEQNRLPELPGLEKILRVSRCDVAWSTEDRQYAQLDPWQTSLLMALDPDEFQDGTASAALSWRGEGGVWRDGAYLHAEPVHLAAGLDNLLLVPIATLDPQELAQLRADVQTALSYAGFELLLGATGDWYVWNEQRLELKTYSPRSGYQQRVYDIMPRGADGPKLRRLMTELQMLLHRHPVNIARERRGEAALNALWFWGAGQLQLTGKKYHQRVLGNRAYVRGLCEHLRLECEPAPQSTQDLLARSLDRVIAVIDMPEDLKTWDQRWLQTIQAALARGEIGSLTLLLDHRRMTASGGMWSIVKNSFKTARPQLTELLA